MNMELSYLLGLSGFSGWNESKPTEVDWSNNKHIQTKKSRRTIKNRSNLFKQSYKSF